MPSFVEYSSKRKDLKGAEPNQGANSTACQSLVVHDNLLKLIKLSNLRVTREMVDTGKRGLLAS